MFDSDMLLKLLIEKFGLRKVTIYGEHYGGKIMGMSKTYGDKKRFVVFDIKLGQFDDAPEMWMAFDKVKILCHELNLDVVHGVIVPTTVEALDTQRDLPSVQAKKCGVEKDCIREGLVLRPLVECDHYGERIIAKYKRSEFMETATPRSLDPARLQVLADAKSIAEEWVTDMRLVHVMDKIPHAPMEGFTMSSIPAIIKAMLEDVKRESKGEVIWTPEVEKAIAGETGKKMKALLAKKLS